MNKFHILGSVALAFSLFFTLGSAATQAQDGSEFAGGNGTEANPWLIEDVYQLSDLNNYVGDVGKDKYFALKNDITFAEQDFSPMGGEFYNDGEFWKPIGPDDSHIFRGNLDGRNHTISGLKINLTKDPVSSHAYGGLFGYKMDGTIKNLKLNCTDTITSSILGYYNRMGYVGAVAGKIKDVTIVNCQVTANINARCYFGGLAGGAEGCIISDCIVNSDIVPWDEDSSDCCIGGVIGIADNTHIKNVTHTGSIIILAQNVGAIGIGGILGRGDGLIIESSTHIGRIKLNKNIRGHCGGLIGLGNGEIKNCHITVDIAGNNIHDTGGLVGRVYYGCTVEDSTVEGTIIGRGVGGIFGSTEGAITLKNCSTSCELNGSSSVGGLIGWQEAADISQTTTLINCFTTGRFILGANDAHSVGGLVGVMRHGSIDNCFSDMEMGLEDIKTFPNYGGGLIGLLYLREGTTCTIKSSYTTRDVFATHYGGGLIGAVDGAYGAYGLATISNSYAGGSVTVRGGIENESIYAGGVVGEGYANITNSYAEGNVTAISVGANSYAGGIAGRIIKGNISSTYAEGNVTASSSAGNSSIGGIAAIIESGIIISNSSANSSALTVDSTKGYGYGRITAQFVDNPSQCYALDTMKIIANGKEITSIGRKGPNTKNGEDKTLTALKQQSTYESGLGWDFKNTWRVDSKKIYPVLMWQKDIPVSTAPTITTQPQSQTVNEGDSVTFSVVVEGGSSSSKADFSTPLSNSVNLDMVWIEPGTFTMGAPSSELGICTDNETQHQVTLTQGYWLGKYEVTQAQYKAVTGNEPASGSKYGAGDNYPLYNMNWYDAKSFCEKLTAQERAAGRLPSGYEYTLPTEAQWEYACRAGTTGAYNVAGAKLTDLGWYVDNSWYVDISDAKAHPVGQKQPNAWGLYDMHGNVMEWCLDWYGDYPASSVTDPKGPSSGTVRVLRGGNWYSLGNYCRSASRGTYDPGTTDYFRGLRVALVPVQAQTSTAADTLTYQWYKDGVAISGATGSSYTIKSVKTSDAGKYTVTVSNSVGSVTSNAATLTVNTAVVKPTITTQPKSQTVTEGNSATFSVAATGTAPLSYQWKKNGSNISGATKSSYTISSAKTSDAGSYTVTVSNSAGSVTSSAATLTVNGTTPIDPNGTAVRSVSRSGKSATVTLKLEPGEDVSVMFVEEHVPSGVTVSVNNGGTYIANRNMIRWSFLDGNAREISYVLTVADDFDGKVSLSGEVTFDETTITVTGTSEIDFAILTHPADMDNDFEVSTKEIASYALAWTKGQNWSREPADIPVTYVARAAMIWVNGGYYTYDASKTEPSCWVSTNVKPSSVELAEASVNVRTINVLDGKAYVSLEVIPAEGISVYFVEEQLPAGMNLNVTNISDGGKYVEGRGLIRWSFLDAEPRTLTYTIEPEAGFSGVITLNGEVTFDEETFITEGDTEANFGGGADVPVITAAYFGGMLIEGTIGGTYVIEYSEDGVNWTKADEITLTASSMYWADLTSANSPKRLYRAKVK